MTEQTTDTTDIREELDELHDLLDETHKLAKDTNHILRAMRRDAWIGLVIRTLFWVVIIVVSTYFTLQLINPLLSSFVGTPGSGGTSMPSSADLQKLLQQYSAQ